MVKGSFYYLYMIEDVWSRKIVGWEIHEEETMELSAQLMRETCTSTGVNASGLVLHSDNGGPMKGSTMLVTLQRLGVVASLRGDVSHAQIQTGLSAEALRHLRTSSRLGRRLRPLVQHRASP